MPPRPHRWLPAALLSALVATVLGCGAPPAQTFAVVLTESRDLECVSSVLPGLPGLPSGPETAYLDQVVSTVPSNWRDLYDNHQIPPRLGGVLHVSDDGERALGWFDTLQQYPYSTWNALVFEGDHHDGFVELGASTPYLDFSGNDAVDPECPEQPQFEGALLATVDGNALEGRLRALDYYYLFPPASPCTAHVTCARSVGVTGSLEP